MRRELVVAIIVGWSAAAFAQPAGTCKPTETQAECHARLKCKADEELEDCQKRVRSSGNTNGNSGNNGNDGGDRGGDDRGGDNRGSDRGGGDRGGDRGGGDNGRRGRSDDGGGSRSGRRRAAAGGKSGGDFEANKTFGLGLELGVPSGITGKYFVGPSTAIDFGLGYIYGQYYYGDGVHLYGDFLWHPKSLVSAEAFELPFYVGVGLRYWQFDFCDRNRLCGYDGSAVGVRVPIGISFDFNNTPLDIFIQLVPTVDLPNGTYYDRYGDRVHLGIDFSAGIRFYFK